MAKKMMQRKAQGNADASSQAASKRRKMGKFVVARSKTSSMGYQRVPRTVKVSKSMMQRLEDLERALSNFPTKKRTMTINIAEVAKSQKIDLLKCNDPVGCSEMEKEKMAAINFEEKTDKAQLIAEATKEMTIAQVESPKTELGRQLSDAQEEAEIKLTAEILLGLGKPIAI